MSNPAKNWFDIERDGESRAIIKILDNIGSGADGESVLRSLEDVNNISLHVNSGGGDASVAMTVYRGLLGRVRECFIHRAHSASVLLTMASERRMIVPAGTLLLHRSTLHARPPLERVHACELRRLASQIERADAETCGVIAERSGLPFETVADWINGKTDRVFAAEEAKALGLVHGIIDAPPSVTFPDPLIKPEETDEEKVVKFLRGFSAINVSNREKFLRNVSAMLVHKVRQ